MWTDPKCHAASAQENPLVVWSILEEIRPRSAFGPAQINAREIRPGEIGAP
jgi:hypothetical protein